ncbi:hypothetical protein ACK249_005716 [Pseudomonas aeruginosa]|uniref:hypothetical protein n=1 Tax=Pseudomonas aeruginosa TaxID=287 RepID=UPI00155F0665|nr:hypothetical protein [Pseudomonas aeruginosa]EKW9639512.1 hypothetical protein [Pseudomonas aeruginosa]NRC34300.1 hypothetical protein [Pseudomonas aeruginosa]
MNNGRHVGTSRRLTLLKRFARSLDLLFLYSDRAKRSRQAASALGIENVELMYDGGLEVGTGALIHQFNTGTPPGEAPYPIVVGVIEDDGHFATFKATYLPQEDLLVASWGKRPRKPQDLWVPVAEFPKALHQAIELSKQKSCVINF